MLPKPTRPSSPSAHVRAHDSCDPDAPGPSPDRDQDPAHDQHAFEESEVPDSQPETKGETSTADRMPLLASSDPVEMDHATPDVTVEDDHATTLEIQNSACEAILTPPSPARASPASTTAHERPTSPLGRSSTPPDMGSMGNTTAGPLDATARRHVVNRFATPPVTLHRNRPQRPRRWTLSEFLASATCSLNATLPHPGRCPRKDTFNVSPRRGRSATARATTSSSVAPPTVERRAQVHLRRTLGIIGVN